MNIYSVVEAFEERVAEYSGAKYGVAVNSCSNAIMLSLVYQRLQGLKGSIDLPKYTYVGVPYSVLNAGFKVNFIDYEWEGNYQLYPSTIIDSARRFRKDMYVKDTLYCLSFHESKLLPIGDGGMILTDDKKAYDALRQIRFDGRTPGLSVFYDDFTLPGYHAHMKPDIATRGVMLMSVTKDYYDDLPGDYPDLSKYPIFTNGY